MTPELFKRLRAHFSEADILELGVTMAIISGMAKLSFVLDVVEKEAYCPFAPSAAA
jgi:alkylhydroperoxidase family enzyme